MAQAEGITSSGPVTHLELNCRGDAATLRITLSPEMAADPIARRRLIYKISALIPSLRFWQNESTRPEILAYHATDADQVAIKSMGPEALNAMLARLDTPVLEITDGLLPMQILVALPYRATRDHMNHLLTRTRKLGVLAVNPAEPTSLYAGYVLTLLVPQRDTMQRNQAGQLRDEVRKAMAFETFRF